MASLRVSSGSSELTLTVHLSRREKLAALRGDFQAPLRAVRSVEVVADGVAAARGLRAPGLAIPGRAKIGTWRGRGRRCLVVARTGVPAVRVLLDGAGVDQLLVSTPDAADVAGALRAAVRAVRA